MSNLEQYPLLVNGRLIATEAQDAVINPATEEILAYAARADEAIVEQAVEAAGNAFPLWSRDRLARSEALHKAAAILTANADLIGRVITAEQGKPLSFARFEGLAAASALKSYADHEGRDETLRDDSEKTITLRRKPHGIVVAITPWNVPIILLFTKIAPALAAGNTVIVKPSEHAPLSTLLIGRLLKDVFPAGVLNILAGDGKLGAHLVRHPQIRNVSFTGSVETGRQILANATQGIKTVALELGGNDAAIVLADADVDAIADKIFKAAFSNSGQICFAIKRLYVHESLHDRLVAALADRATRAVVGDGAEDATELGPLTTAAQRDRVAALVEDAVKRGAKVNAGGHRLNRKGYFFAPTILSHVPHDARVITEEQFGPVLPVISFEDVDTAVALANDTNFGLGASVWSRDAARASEIADRLEAGLIWVNAHADIHPGAPKGGQKWSGLGLEGGRWGYEHFTHLVVRNLHHHQETSHATR